MRFQIQSRLPTVPPLWKAALWIGVALLYFCFWLALPALLSELGEQGPHIPRQTICLSNIKQQSLGILMYAQDFDEKLPRSNRWTDAVMPYIKLEGIFRCPSVKEPQTYGYAFNSALSRQRIPTLKEPSVAILTYDSLSSFRNAADPTTSLPAPGRHNGYNNISYADGHARARKEPKTP